MQKQTNSQKTEPYCGEERRIADDPTHFGFFALEGLERRRFSIQYNTYNGKDRRVNNDPSYFGYYALEGVERRQADNVLLVR